ncbi:hypothetical protein PHET_01356 [Paragonimus heterotremus]|uniref:Uncharacterized protein n=1 Tax=Paragonimus heterotremus TaxID=100268 RepID=A0A8J4T5P5_9TREM|nr:hypothetical protein PHET_01356 [Paragonimus heterotremus]
MADEQIYDYSSDEEVIEFRRRNEDARKARERARQTIFDEVKDTDTSHIRQLSRDVSNRVFDEYMEAKNKSKEQDRRTLDYIDQILNQTSLSYGPQRKSTVPLVSRSRCGSQWKRDLPMHPKEDLYLQLPEEKTNGFHRNGDLHEEWRKAEPSSSETARQRIRRIEAHLDGILDYELPSAENFKNMRHSLREINDKMATHKFLLDRRTNFGMDDDNRKVSERIDDKYRELEERMPCLTSSERTRTRQCKSAFDPNLIAGYATGLSVTNSDQTAELRGRIRTLLCRTRRTAESEDAHTSAARRRREATVK